MSVPPESVAVGKCYVTSVERGLRLLRVVLVREDGRVQYDYCNRYGLRNHGWKAGIVDQASFARMAEREVPCDWTPEADG
jgi:hypothetical protein